MEARGEGRIALTGSMASRNAGTTGEGEPAYTASKGAFSAMVRYLARQYAPKGIIVNAVAPGPILTPLLISGNQPWQPETYPMRRLGKPEEIAWPLAFLASKGATFATGMMMDVNGGICFS
jgi:NAD(P)-dependent dehydrogenase (short-subunit alcohol dehydrogenase family)